MDYSIFIPNWKAGPEMVLWLKDNVRKDNYLWDIAPGARVLYLKYEADLLVFRLRWSI